MQIPEPYWSTFTLRGGSRSDVCGYQHSVAVLLPWRRYRQHWTPRPAEGSPSRIEVGEETRHGTELSVIRDLLLRTLPEDAAAEMSGELAEAWVSMTYNIRRHVV